MRGIPLTRGRFTIIDEQDFDSISKHNWQVVKRDNKKYARARLRGSGNYVYLHRFLIGQAGLHVDHINGNGLDNRRSNLRIATNAQNMANMKRLSGHKGYSRSGKRFRAYIVKDGKQYWLGLFDTATDAAKAYDTAAIKMFGKFARPNIMREYTAAECEAKFPCLGERK